MYPKLAEMTPDRASQLQAIADSVVSGLDEFKRLAVPARGYRFKYKLVSLRDRAADVMAEVLRE
jgi:hypothetical protein